MTQADVKKNYKETLNLPQTGFPMEAKLTQNEPKRLARWQEMGLYQKLLDARKDAEKWILHDGPPFANGDIHIGHLINKTLKDVIIRFRTMEGKQTPYVPGWDCHGLPIEHKIQQDLGSKLREMSVLDIRQRCFAYAEKYAAIQSTQFQRLGILGEWENPYLTMKPSYEASTLEVFAKIVERGLVYRKLKPVPWSVANQTALADAELEYQDVTDSSVFVEFPLLTPSPGTPGEGWGEGAFLLVWTTTPWTLPANLAVAVHPDLKYEAVSYVKNGEKRTGIVAADLAEKVLNREGIERTHASMELSGRDLAGATYRHPFLERTGKVVLADYVTATDGTGLVHTAPGHGEDDYETGIREGLEVYSPVLYNGRFDDTVPEWLCGKTVWEANGLITQKLIDLGLLFAEQKITHSYPHDWRSKTPIIFRATEQWFISMDEKFATGTDGSEPRSLRKRAQDAVGAGEINPSAPKNKGEATEIAASEDTTWRNFAEKVAAAGGTHPGISDADLLREAESEHPQIDFHGNRVKFVPAWGRHRMLGMLKSRPDWCISRQRAWGLPIPVFFGPSGTEHLLTPASIRAVAKQVARHGSDYWFTARPSELLDEWDLGKDPKLPGWLARALQPPGTTLDDVLRKSADIFDVWFESGSSWHAVLQARPNLKFPADLYLEGSDQHRGWFQLSLLPSMAATGEAPFKQVLTHGFVVKPDGTKVSKSDKEYVKAVDEINRHGADVLRLWCCSVDYQNDIPTSPKAIQEFGDKYRKIRNTLRFLMANLADFDPAVHAQDIPLNSLDGWAADQLDTVIEEVWEAYDGYQLHRVFRLLHDFCAVQVSAIYGNALKDRLYCELPNSPIRRRCQTVLHRMLLAVTKLLAPMLVFTADEAWEHIAHKPADEAGMPSVHLARLRKKLGSKPSHDQDAEWTQLFELRDKALLQLDALKKEAGLNKALDAEVVYHVGDAETRRRLEAYGIDLEDIVGAGFHSIVEAATEGPAVVVQMLDRRETYKACARSWKRRPDVGQDAEYPDLSQRDAAAVRELWNK